MDNIGAIECIKKASAFHITLANPPANPLSLGTMRALQQSILDADADKDVRVIVIGHQGSLFSAGHDLKELTSHRDDDDGGAAFFTETFDTCAELMLTITRCSKPVIAVVNGLATAAGCQLVATCDLAICTDKATFCTPGVNIGLFCSTPMVALTRNIGRKQAMEMLLTGETIDAGTAKDFGLVNRIVPENYLGQVVDKYIASIAQKSGPVVAIGKKSFYEQADMPLSEAYAYASAVMTQNMQHGDACEGINAFLEKRKASWAGNG